jgi:hypothetical protein
MSKSPLSESLAVAGTRLVGRVVRVGEIGSPVRARMYGLLQAYFANTSRERFAADLAEKEWAILLTDEGGQLRGFSTLMRLEGTAAGEPYVAFFSGDTIIHRDFWGEMILPRLWARHVFALAEQVLDRRVWWFLISSGYKTYRFLPVFFRTFYPAFDRPLPAGVRAVLDDVAGRKFPREYDPGEGVIRLQQPSPVRPGVAEISPERLRDPHVAFFAAANPGWRVGEELACLTEISRANLTPAGVRMLKEGA